MPLMQQKNLVHTHFKFLQEYLVSPGIVGKLHPHLKLTLRCQAENISGEVRSMWTSEKKVIVENLYRKH